jgi:hypothetical protein
MRVEQLAGRPVRFAVGGGHAGCAGRCAPANEAVRMLRQIGSKEKVAEVDR